MPIAGNITYDAKRKVWSSPNYPHWSFINQSLGEAFVQQMKKLPADQILEQYVDTDEIRTSNQIYRESVAVAKNLKKLGLKRDEVIVVCGGNNMKVTPLIMSAFLMGAKVNVFETAMKPEYFDSTLRLLEPAAIFYEEVHANTISDSLKRSPLTSVRYQLSLDGSQVPNFDSELLQPVTEDELANFHPAQVDDPQHETALLALTSGSTGPPKVVNITHSLLLHANVSWFYHMNKSSPFTSKSSVFSFAPLRWISQFDLMLVSLLFGVRRVCATKPANGPYGCDIIRKTGITHIFLLPQALEDILNTLEDTDTQSMSSLRVLQVGGEKASKAVYQLAQKHCVNAKTYSCFGMTELAGLIANAGDGNAGKLVPGIQIQILDDDMQPLGPNQHGQVYLKTLVPFKPYLKIDSSAHYFPDGFFLSGDYGYVDEQHNLHLEARYKDLVRAKDVIIIPNNVEYQINDLPEVVVSRLVGYRQSEDSTADVGALFVVLESFAKDLPSGLVRLKIRDVLLARLSPKENANIEKIIFISKIPVTNCGKVDRVELRKQASLL
uniref:Putative acyl--CoA ligase YdaB n=1 Tax=Zeugodacus cucurbitae TaxID=28588 RepID=A0A0A1X6R7_ZEUCU